MSLRAFLKDQTKEIHSLLEDTGVLSRLTAPDLQVSEYIRALRSLYRLHEAFDRQMAKNKFDLGPVQVRIQQPKLRQDLEFYGEHSFLEAVERGAFESSAHRPFHWLESEAQAVGAVYVIEGSSLGGMVIAQALVKSLGLTVNSGASFFAGDADLIKNRWLPFTRWLDQQNQFEIELVAQASRETFLEVAHFFKD